MTGRPAGLVADPPPPAPVPEPAISPRDALGERYAAELLAAFRAIHETSGHVVAHLEGGGDAQILLAQISEFDALVKAAGAALMGLGCVASSDGVA